MSVAPPSRSVKPALGLGAVLFAIALGLMHLSTPSGVQREVLQIPGPDGRPLLGDHWIPEDAQAALVIGHGVSENRGTMATMAKAFAARGYDVVAIDFWGHGRSREPFDWNRNKDQVLAWLDWARTEYPDLPLAYLGHSMGGGAGNAALLERSAADAFICLGMLPRDIPEMPTLIALGRFEELFTPEQARQRADGKADVLVSPWSNHALEPWDPVLIRDMADWTDRQFHLGAAPFPWGRWLSAMTAVDLGVVGLLCLCFGVAALFGATTSGVGSSPASTRRWSINPYRLAGRLVGVRDHLSPPRSSAPLRAILGGIFGSLVLIGGLALLLDSHMFTSRPDHPARLLFWITMMAAFLPLCWLDAWALERTGPPTMVKRFVLGALTKALPLFSLGAILWFWGPGIAFMGLMLSILAFIALMQSLVYTLMLVATGDYRAGVLASALTVPWVFSFWFPMNW